MFFFSLNSFNPCSKLSLFLSLPLCLSLSVSLSLCLSLSLSVCLSVCLYLSLSVKDAYDALISNPDPSRRRDCLRQFLIILTEKGQLQPLVNFQYEDLQNDVVQILEARARATDVVSASTYYDLLYAFHVHRENYRQVCPSGR